ncbi:MULTISPECIES: tripartite tricarboxylate transporter substrate binding protein [unclassified Achromobacter]|uniref:Bug family tripartite tricarboxylate transporter substrate binding protein n=1 Tax=unclassified Achromobacter TaxID=2626865 RepID=UPI0013030638|nr:MULTISPECIES: tripartite tricarboxylate transporter substrate binding protein [unclassified Achromobacter]
MYKVLFKLMVMAGCAAATTVATAAETYPARPVRMVVAYPAGGSTDIAARVLAKSLTERMKGSFVVENRGGGGGVIGAGLVANSTPDGYTLLFAASPELSIAKWTKKDVAYDAEKDFAPVAMIGQVPFVLVANKEFPPNNVQELIAYAKAHPGAVNFSSFGSGTSNHLAGELMNLQAGIKMTHVPYRGSSPSLTDLMGGQIQITFDTITAVLPLIQAGKIKALAMATPQRSALLPDLPTVAESGLPGFSGGTWFGLVAPKGTPAAVVQALSQSTIASLNDAAVKKDLENRGIVPDPQGPAYLAKYLADESAKWSKVTKQIGLQPQ